MKAFEQLIKKPIYLKALLIIRCIVLETYVHSIIGKVLGVIIIILSAMYLINDFFHEKRFINHKWSFFPITFFVLISVSLLINALRFGDIVIALKSIVANAIYLLILVAPSGTTNINERNCEIYRLANVLICTMAPLGIIGASLFFIRISIFLPFLQIPERYLLVINDKIYNTYWIERFFMPFVNPNGAAALFAITSFAIVFCILYKKQNCIMKVWYYLVFLCSIVVFLGCASRGAILGLVVSLGFGTYLVFKRYYTRKLEHRMLKFVLSIGAGFTVCLLIMCLSLWMSSKLPQVSSLVTEKYIEFIDNIGDRKNEQCDINEDDTDAVLNSENSNEDIHEKPSGDILLAPYATESINRDMTESDGIQTRLNIWKVYINNIKYHPWIGIGINHDNIPYENYIDEHYDNQADIPYIISRLYNDTFGCHNAYIDIIARYGIPAFLFFLWFVYMIQKYAIEVAIRGNQNESVINEDILLVALVAMVMTLGLTGSYLLSSYTLPNVMVWGAVGYLCNVEYSPQWLNKKDFNLMHKINKNYAR